MAAPPGSGASSYLLPASPATRQHDSRLIVNLAPIDTATFLDGEGIVMQLDELEVHQARGHLWAEAPPNQLQHLLQRRLSSALPQAQVVTRGQVQATSTAGEGRELRLRLDRFQDATTALP
ncbi:PqiC family protein [Oceanimonas sp. NS1]|nr:PqiC family protein [Oceanimonas sp. NS1]